MNCDFLLPVDITGAPAVPVSGTEGFFAFSKMICTNDKFQQYTQAGTGSANFYLQKTISYGDIFVILFFIFFFCALIFKLLWNFNWKDEKAKL
jgi:hypothetical protein